MGRIKKALKVASRRGPLRIAKRLVLSLSSLTVDSSQAVSWAISRTEDSNFYYGLTERNRLHLANQLATILDLPVQQIEAYFAELESGIKEATAIAELKAVDSGIRDSTFLPGRRLGWYAFIRAMKPKFVLETGVHQGLGALVICLALEQNLNEGHPGRYLGTDIDPRAGAMIKSMSGGFNFDFADVIIGDSIKTIERISDEIDLYISDSDHTAGYEERELLAASEKLSKFAVVLSDNAHATDVLMDWSRRNNRPFVFFKEQPANHWYRGAGIGISMPLGA